MREIFLVQRDKKGMVSSELADRLVEEDIVLGTLIDPNWEIYINKRANSDRKTAWATRVAGLPDNEFAGVVQEHLGLLDSAIEYLLD